MKYRRVDLRTDFRTPPPDGPDNVALGGAGIVAVAAAIVACAHLLPGGPARAVVVVPLVLLVPGWAAYVCVFGRSRPTDPVIALTFVTGLGMGVLIVNGLLVNALGIRLSEPALVIGPAVISSVLFAVGRARGGDPALLVPISDLPRLVVPTLVLCCSVALAAAAVTYAADRLPSPHATPFAEVSFAPAYARAGRATRVVPHQVVPLPIQVRLRGDDRISYRVHTYVDGVQVAAFGTVMKAPVWTGAVEVSAPEGRCLHRVRIVFTPVAAPDVRTVSLDTYLKVVEGPSCPR